jgi:preprotein translocase subunit SecE
VPRDRQRAKRRQAERREARLRERRRAGDGDGARESPTPPPRDSGTQARPGADGAAAPAREPAAAAGEPAPDDALIAASAPPQTAGRSDTVVEAPPPAPQLEEEDQAAAPLRDPARVAGPEERRHGRVVSFLVAVWAELQRVQWPDRKTLTTLTGVVLGFVLVAGGYLGALDAIVSRVMESIL